MTKTAEYTYKGKAAYFCAAQFDGECCVCAGPVEMNESIVYVPRAKAGWRMMHDKCAAADGHLKKREKNHKWK